jgi:hypothetical protein
VCKPRDFNVRVKALFTFHCQTLNENPSYIWRSHFYLTDFPSQAVIQLALANSVAARVSGLGWQR